jgi:hypothetical protein
MHLISIFLVLDLTELIEQDVTRCKDFVNLVEYLSIVLYNENVLETQAIVTSGEEWYCQYGFNINVNDVRIES